MISFRGGVYTLQPMPLATMPPPGRLRLSAHPDPEAGTEKMENKKCLKMEIQLLSKVSRLGFLASVYGLNDVLEYRMCAGAPVSVSFIRAISI